MAHELDFQSLRECRVKDLKKVNEIDTKMTIKYKDIVDQEIVSNNLWSKMRMKDMYKKCEMQFHGGLTKNPNKLKTIMEKNY